MVTDEELSELEALAAAATPGPWRIADGGLTAVRGPDDERVCSAYDSDARHSEPLPFAATPEEAANAALIARAVNALPALIAEVRRLRAELSDRDTPMEPDDPYPLRERYKLLADRFGHVKRERDEARAEVERLRAAQGSP